MTTLGNRAAYESGGWNDGRIGQAYDLLAAYLRERGIDTFRNELLASLEALDEEAGQSEERA